MGYCVETIQYTRTAINTNHISFIKQCLRLPQRIIHRILSKEVETNDLIYKKNTSMVRKKLFEEFIEKNMKTSKQRYNKDNISTSNDEYDCFVCGSDNIWNKNLFDSAFMLDFALDSKMKIAYAPGMSTDRLTRHQRTLFLSPIKRLDFISCREKIGADLLSKYLRRSIPVVCDPTLLLTAEQWRSVEAKPHFELPQKYIFAYICSKNTHTQNIIYNIYKESKLPVVVIPDMGESYNLNQSEYIYLNDVGPAEFIYLIDHACLVVTDSFHGTVFSCIMNREFWSFNRFKSENTVQLNQRINNLLRILNISEKRILTEYNENYHNCPIDWDDANSYRENEREKSIEYLKSTLGGAQ